MTMYHMPGPGGARTKNHAGAGPSMGGPAYMIKKMAGAHAGLGGYWFRFYGRALGRFWGGGPYAGRSCHRTGGRGRGGISGRHVMAVYVNGRSYACAA